MTDKRDDNRIDTDKRSGEISAESMKIESDANKMGTVPVGRLLASMAWPAILSMTINALYNVVDSIFVGMLSKDALTAVSFVNPIQLLMVALSIGSAVGVNSLIARRLGARRIDDADMAASISIRIGLFNFVIFFLVGLFVSVPFMGYYTDDEVIYTYGVQYMRIVTMGSVFVCIQVMFEKVLQSMGNMIATMVISLTGALVNLALDPVLIFGLFGIPRLEVMGAATATIIGQACGLSMAVFIFFRRKRDVRIRLKGYKMDWQVVKDIYAVGLPGIVMQSIGSFMLLAYNSIIASSATAVAVLGVYFKLQSFVFMPVIGVNQGSMPIMGYNYGARNKKRLMDTYKVALITAFLIMLAGCIIFQLFPEKLLALFSADDDMLKIGVPALRLISICFVPASFGIMTSTLFQATGHGVYSLFASLLRQFFGILPLVYILYNYVGLSMSWASFPLAEIIGTIYAIVMLRHLYKKEIKNM